MSRGFGWRTAALLTLLTFCLLTVSPAALAAGPDGCAGAVKATCPFGSTTLLGPIRPPLPPSGVYLKTGCGNGQQRCQGYVPVDRQVTGGVVITGHGHVLHIGSVTVNLGPWGASATAEMAVAVVASPGAFSGACGSLDQTGDPYLLRYGRAHWPSSVQGSPFDYPPSPRFLSLLRREGWIGPGRLDLADAPAASQPTDVRSVQPTAGELPALRGLVTTFPALAGMHLPGVLFVNTVLWWDGAQWHVAEWNFNFDLAAGFVKHIARCGAPPDRLPPPQHVTGDRQLPGDWDLTCPDGRPVDPSRTGGGCAAPVLVH